MPDLQPRAPLVSCVMPTRNRPQFVSRAIANFARQSYGPNELIVIDDGEEPVEHLCDAPSVRYIRLPGTRPLGTKLNLGIEQASGEHIIKWDDDDWYHPKFIGAMLQALMSATSDQVVAVCGCFLIFVAGENFFRFSGEGLAAGGTLTFSKTLWQRVAFRDVGIQEDYWFRVDTGNRIVRVNEPELYVLVRHGRNTWVRNRDGRVTDQVLRALPRVSENLSRMFSPEEEKFYLSLPPSAPSAEGLESGV